MKEFNRAEYDASWNCKFCEQHFVVPQLARDHELKCYCNPDYLSSSEVSEVSEVA